MGRLAGSLDRDIVKPALQVRHFIIRQGRVKLILHPFYDLCLSSALDLDIHSVDDDCARVNVMCRGVGAHSCTAAAD